MTDKGLVGNEKIEEDIRMLEREGKKFWRAVQEDREPPLKITM